MSKLVIAQVPADDIELISRSSKKGARGARVYGLPVSREIESYISDVAPESEQQRIINMFFAGKMPPVDIEEEDEEVDF